MASYTRAMRKTWEWVQAIAAVPLILAYWVGALIVGGLIIYAVTLALSGTLDLLTQGS